MIFNKATINKKLIMLPTIACFILIALLLFVIFPLKSRISLAKETYFENQLKEKSLAFQLQKQDVSDQLKSTIKNDQSKIDQTILHDNETLKFITALESLAEGLAITDQRFSLSEFIPAETGFKTLTVTIDFTADYTTFVNYIYQLENSSIYIRVNSIDASSKENINILDESTENAEVAKKISIHLTAQTYWQDSNE